MTTASATNFSNLASSLAPNCGNAGTATPPAGATFASVCVSLLSHPATSAQPCGQAATRAAAPSSTPTPKNLKADFPAESSKAKKVSEDSSATIANASLYGLVLPMPPPAEPPLAVALSQPNAGTSNAASKLADVGTGAPSQSLQPAVANPSMISLITELQAGFPAVLGQTNSPGLPGNNTTAGSEPHVIAIALPQQDPAPLNALTSAAPAAPPTPDTVTARSSADSVATEPDAFPVGNNVASSIVAEPFTHSLDSVHSNSVPTKEAVPATVTKPSGEPAPATQGFSVAAAFSASQGMPAQSSSAVQGLPGFSSQFTAPSPSVNSSPSFTLAGGYTTSAVRAPGTGTDAATAIPTLIITDAGGLNVSGLNAATAISPFAVTNAESVSGSDANAVGVASAADGPAPASPDASANPGPSTVVSETSSTASAIQTNAAQASVAAAYVSLIAGPQGGSALATTLLQSIASLTTNIGAPNNSKSAISASSSRSAQVSIAITDTTTHRGAPPAELAAQASSSVNLFSVKPSTVNPCSVSPSSANPSSVGAFSSNPSSSNPSAVFSAAGFASAPGSSHPVPATTLEASANATTRLGEPGSGSSKAVGQVASSEKDVQTGRTASGTADQASQVAPGTAIPQALAPQPAEPLTVGAACVNTGLGSSAGQAQPPSSLPKPAAGNGLASADSPDLMRAAGEPPTAAAVGPVQMAHITNQAAQSEMRIGLTTSAFGNVEVRTVVHASDVGLAIGSEKGDLRSLLANDMPGIANTLQQQNLRLSSVNFQQGFSFSGNLSGGGESQQRSFAPLSASAANPGLEAHGDDAFETRLHGDVNHSGGSLSILA